MEVFEVSARTHWPLAALDLLHRVGHEGRSRRRNASSAWAAKGRIRHQQRQLDAIVAQQFCRYCTQCHVLALSLHPHQLRRPHVLLPGRFFVFGGAEARADGLVHDTIAISLPDHCSEVWQRSIRPRCHMGFPGGPGLPELLTWKTCREPAFCGSLKFGLANCSAAYEQGRVGGLARETMHSGHGRRVRYVGINKARLDEFRQLVVNEARLDGCGPHARSQAGARPQ